MTFFLNLGVMLDSKFTFERHIRSISSSVAQMIGLFRKYFRILGDHDVLLIEMLQFFLSFLVFSIAPLFDPLQLIPILNSLIRIYELDNSNSYN